MRFRFVLVCLAVSLLAGCCHPGREPRATATTDPGQGILRLYFGRSASGNGASSEISAERFQAFVSREIVPRFPAGLTIYHTQGVWRGNTGLRQDEPSEVAEIVGVSLATARDLGDVIADRYKAEFAQESVLIVMLPGTATFR